MKRTSAPDESFQRRYLDIFRILALLPLIALVACERDGSSESEHWNVIGAYNEATWAHWAQAAWLAAARAGPSDEAARALLQEGVEPPTLHAVAAARAIVESNHERDTVTDYLADDPLSWVVWHVGTDSELVRKWRITGYPTYVLIGPEGTILNKHAGTFDAQFRTETEQAVAESGS